jgi:DNA repair protein RecO (recombination protein O)
VVLRCTDYSESSQVAAILTPDLGQIHVLAKGTRRPRKDGRGALDLLNYCDLVLAKRPPGQLHILAEWSLREMFPRLRASLGCIWAACYAVEVVLVATSENPDDGLLCEHLVDLLRRLDRSVGVAGERAQSETLALFRFLLSALRTLGTVPATETCAHCGGPLQGSIRFSPASGGALCGDCAAHDPTGFFISRGSLSVLNRLGAEHGGDAPLRLTADQVREIRRAFNEQIQYHLGRQLKTERFLAQV